MTLPLPLAPAFEQRYLKIDATTGLLTPNDGGFIFTTVAGSSTPLATYTNASSPLVAHTNPIELDSDGRPPSPIYVLGRGYKFVVKDSNLVTLYTIDPVEDSAFVALTTTANVQAEGVTVTVSPYTVAAGVNTVICNCATNPTVIQLPPAADRGTPIVIKNIRASVVVRVTPDGAETIDTVAAFYAVPAAVSPLMPSIVLNSNGVSAWTIPSSHGI